MIVELARKLEFPEEAIAYLSVTLTDMTATGTLPELYAAMDDWYWDRIDAWNEKMERVTTTAKVNRYAADMVFLLLAARPLAYIYHANGLSEEL